MEFHAIVEGDEVEKFGQDSPANRHPGIPRRHLLPNNQRNHQNDRANQNHLETGEKVGDPVFPGDVDEPLGRSNGNEIVLADQCVQGY